jgi:quercetin dioxygenase-like cupin family protein
MTLLALAQQTGLSSSMLSLLERGKTAPSIGTLVALGSALDVPTAELMAGPSGPGPTPPVSRHADQPVHATPDGVRRRVLRSDPGRGIEIAMVEFGAGTASAPHPTTHGGYEFGIAIEGPLEVTVGGEVFVLKEGDLVSYKSTDPHRIANRGKRAVRALWVNLRQG